MTVTGAAAGDAVFLGVPNGSVNANSAVTAWVSAANTVTVRFNNYSAGNIDPANGTFTADQFDTIMRLAGGRRVVFVNIKAGRSWQDGNNSLLWSKVQQYPNASLIDWYSASVNHPEYFAGDGIHPSAAGIRAYGSLIAARLPR